jgi:excisionase family DNA binding protein
MNAVASNNTHCHKDNDSRSSKAEQQTTQPSDLLKALLEQNGLLSNEEAAAYLGVSPGTLEVWRSTKRYSLAYIKVGRLVKYRKEMLDAFLAAQTVVV